MNRFDSSLIFCERALFDSDKIERAFYKWGIPVGHLRRSMPVKFSGLMASVLHIVIDFVRVMF